VNLLLRGACDNPLNMKKLRVPRTRGNAMCHLPQEYIQQSIENPTRASMAISLNLEHVRPCRITAITITTSIETFVSDLERVHAILKDICPHVGHVRHLIVSLNGGFVFFFSIATGMRESMMPIPLDICTANLAELYTIIDQFRGLHLSSMDAFCNRAMDGFLPIHPATISPLVALLVTLRNEASWALCYRMVDAVTGPKDPRLCLDAKVTRGDKFWTDSRRLSYRRWFSFFTCDGNKSPDVEIPTRLDFSMCDELDALDIATKREIHEIILPTKPDNLSILILDIPQYRGSPLLTSGPVFPLLEAVTLPIPDGPIPLTSARFPAMRYFETPMCSARASVDFSKHTIPECKFSLAGFKGEIILPLVPVHSLYLNRQSLHSVTLCAALPRFQEICFDLVHKDDVDLLFSKFSTAPMASALPSPYANLRSLILANKGGMARVNLNHLHSLRNLFLLRVTADISGDNFPFLETLSIGRNGMLPTGRFPELTQLNLGGMELEGNFPFSAPSLQSIHLGHVSGANRVFLREAIFPELRVLTVYPSLNRRSWMLDKYCFPRFAQDSYMDRQIVLHVYAPIRLKVKRRMTAAVPGMLICS